MKKFATSLHNFTGFHTIVTNTNHWFTVGKSVDLTEYVYGKQLNIKRKGFSLVKWLASLANIKKQAKRLARAVRVLSKAAKFGVKIAKFGFKLLSKIIKFVKNTIGKGIKKLFSIIRKGKFKIKSFGFDKLIDKLKPLFTKSKEFITNFKSRVKTFFNKKIIDPVKRKISKWITRLSKVVKVFWGAIKGVKNLFGSITNVVVGKGKLLFSKAGEKFIKSGKALKSIAGSTINFFKQGTNKIVSKVVGLGKDAVGLAVKTKEGIIQSGQAAAGWIGKTKKKWRVGFKLLKRRMKKSGKNFVANSRVLKWGKAIIGFFIKLAVGLFKVLLSAGKSIVSFIANAAAAVTAGLSYLLPLLMGAVIEFIFQKSQLLEPGISAPTRLWRIGRYIFDVIMWCMPGGGLIKSVVNFLLSLVPDALEFIYGQAYDYIAYRKGKLNEYDAQDIIFSSKTHQTISNINDLQKHILTKEILTAKEHTDSCNVIMNDIINRTALAWKKRSSIINNMNTLFA